MILSCLSKYAGKVFRYDERNGNADDADWTDKSGCDTGMPERFSGSSNKK